MIKTHQLHQLSPKILDFFTYKIITNPVNTLLNYLQTELKSRWLKKMQPSGQIKLQRELNRSNVLSNPTET